MNARRWLPPLFWAGVILVATSIPNPHVPVQVDGLDKVVHFTLYAVLGWLAVRALAGVRSPVVALAIVLVAASAFGAADEWHQQFIPGRSADAADWSADSLGALCGAAAYALLGRRRTPTLS